MPNQINIQAALTVQNATVSVLQGAGTWPITQTGSRAVANLVKVNSSHASDTVSTIEFNVGTVGYLFVKNQDTNNFVKLALDSGLNNIFAKIRPNEFCLVPVNQSTFYARHSGTTQYQTADVLFVAAEL
jgi:hypothetical protein